MLSRFAKMLAIKKQPLRNSKTKLRRKLNLALEQLEVREMPAAFTPGTLVVERMGDGTAALSSVATAVFLDQFNTTGTGQTGTQIVAMPTVTSGTTHALTGSGSATSEGLLNRSVDGRFLTVAGYDAAPGTSGVVSTASATNPRVVGLVSAGGTTDTSTALTDAYTGNNIRSAITVDGSAFWTSGAGTAGAGAAATAGIHYASSLGATTSTNVSNFATGTGVVTVRALSIFNNQLYTDASSAGNSGNVFGPATVGSGL